MALDATAVMIATESPQDCRANPGAAAVSAARVSKGLRLLDGSAATPGILISRTAQASALAAVYMQGEH